MSSNYYVYMLKCKDKSIYTGIALDPYKRLEEHNAGTGAKYTRSRRPVELVYLETSGDRSVAQSREYALKQLSHQEKLDLINSEYNEK